MPPKRATSKKATTKTVASSTATADAKLLNNGEKEVAAELANDAVQNDVEDLKELTTTKSRTAKRSSGRAKIVAQELEIENVSTVTKNPPARSRGGKSKSNKNEVKENENIEEAIKQTSTAEEVTQEEIGKEEEAKIKSKGRGAGGGKKAEKKPRKGTKTKEKSTKSAEIKQEEQSTEETKEVKVAENKTKSVGIRKKKSVAEEVKAAVKEEFTENVEKEKVFKKSLRSSKKDKEKVKEVSLETESAKKKGKSNKKEKSLLKNEVEEEVEELAEVAEVSTEEVKLEAKEKKPTKRGRNAKRVNEPVAVNGHTEEVLPKKRSRKAPSVKKEVVADKPKRQRGKKAGKEKALPESKNLQGIDEVEEELANGQDKEENTEKYKESSSSNKTIEEPVVSASATAAKAKGGRKRSATSAKTTSNKKSANSKSSDDVDGGEKLNDNGVVNPELEEDDEADNDSKPSNTKTKKKSPDSTVGFVNSTTTIYNKTDFDLPLPAEGETVEEPRFNFKISSWNVTDLRDWVKNEGLKFVEYEQPDIFCMQETKCINDLLPEEVQPIPGYHPYWLCMSNDYAGVAIYSKIMPINVDYGIGNNEFDDCGRIITAEYEKFFLINVYVPHSGTQLVNLESRMKWENLFKEFIQNLNERKPVLICGDMNVAHQEHDLAYPKTNTRMAGFTKEERDKMSELLALGYIDTYRHFYPKRKGAYTFWTYMANARARNVGWRLDYFIVSERFISRVVDNCIRSQCMGSDHCPITLFLKL